ncbi:FAD-dependent pyridine nucleotide-disulfide oxidoreductase [Cordyceps fumosorosea ARSEF 2679]|uniref:FAD-dependent pyridine nucleotide-disulfide oxidoreductase n=1 Tax=Cordyceps fumosorosea (strain ARSEF 2679) TaxID=1081104 RepID=A0A162JIH3_CORFA|nr:FAD-dependent pyridine nucleotide-disulfide oxidoreductase [Cordyceps fumosorosea ARSEF 2679]OAA69492.1 FAD-dependent pyridine nucleotide-disulfide oxidoreductase [Cordyceps fumosorosea ARSEF 2679]
MLDKAILCFKLVFIFARVMGGEIRRLLRFRWVRNQAKKTGSTPSTERTHNIVVVGASFAGHYAARIIARSLPPNSKHRVVVIEPNSHFQFTWVLPRFCVIPGGHEHKAFVPYGKYADAVDGALHWIKDRVASVNESEVVLQDAGERIPYTYLVIATGAAVQSGLPSRVNSTEKVEGIKLMQAMQQRIANAETVVVVGGGAAGVEVATDAKSLYPDKHIILVHSRGSVMQRFGKELQTAATEGLKRLEVEVILEDRVVEEDGVNGTVTLKSGRKINCGCFINCTGQKPNSSILSTLSPASISSSGYIKVKPTLQLIDENFQNIYSCGDVTDTDVPTPNARSAMQQSIVAAENILLAIEGKAPQHEYRHSWPESMIKLTLGLDRSVSHLSDGKSDILFRSKEKNEALMAAQCWKSLGQAPFEDEYMQNKEPENKHQA